MRIPLTLINLNKMSYNLYIKRLDNGYTVSSEFNDYQFVAKDSKELEALIISFDTLYKDFVDKNKK